MNSRIILAIIVVFSVITFSMIPFQQLTVVPTSIQEAQANPCANEISRGGSADNAFIPKDDDERECDFTGYFDFDEEIGSENIPPPRTGAFTIGGQGTGLIACGALVTAATIEISAQGEEDGTVTGTVGIGGPGIGTNLLPVNDGTTDGNTFSLSGESGLCGGPFTLSGNCGTSVAVSYEDDGGSGTFTGDVECTPV